MQRHEMIAMLRDEPELYWDGRFGFRFTDNRENDKCIQVTKDSLCFYNRNDRHWQGWKRYERLRFDKCEVDMNYPNYIFIKTKQPRSRRLVEILENRG